MKLEHVNAMPAPTWHWLKVSETEVQVPELEPADASAIAFETSVKGAGEALSFDAALEDMDAKYTERRASAPGDEADRARVTPETELDVPAVSRYQAGAIHLEEALCPSEAFETGMGDEGHSYLSQAAARIGSAANLSLCMPAGASETATLSVTGADGKAAVAALDVVAQKGSNLKLTVSLDSPAEGSGLAGVLLRVFAGEGARVSITGVQTLADGYIALDDTGLFLDENARVDVRHEVLGAGAAYVGLAGDLLGDQSKVTIDTDYLGAREQLRDFNYELRHRGKKTECNIDANGVLTGTSKKVLRGTIDLAHGCKGSQGNERETVLLANQGVENKTVPVILCDEDDVAGNHGATIGHVRDEQLFYLACRGLSPEDAENLFVRAKLEDAALSAPSNAIRQNVLALGNTVIPHFGENFAEEM